MVDKMVDKLKARMDAKRLVYLLALLLLVMAMPACQPEGAGEVRSEMMSSRIGGLAVDELAIPVACAILKGTESIAKMVGHQLVLMFGYRDHVALYRSVQWAYE